MPSYQALEAQMPQEQGYADPHVSRMEERDQRIKTRVRKLRVFIRLLAFGCSAVVVALMIDNLVIFYETANRISQGVRLWPNNAKLWPTYLALGIASLSAVLATIVLLAYCWGTKAANRWNTARTTVTIVTLIFNIVIWGIAAAGLQATSSFDGIGSQSLWSATCDATDQQHELFGHVINLSRFCLMQTWAFICAFIAIALELLTAISYIYVVLRIRHKKHIKRLSSFVLRPPSYPPPQSSPPSSYFGDKSTYEYTPQPSTEYLPQRDFRG